LGARPPHSTTSRTSLGRREPVAVNPTRLCRRLAVGWPRRSPARRP
jgi:hypothetical protein